jgi:hypothetical protein
MSVKVVSLAAEFPNDNPALHAGVSWVCLTPLARPTPELSIHEPPPITVPEPPTLAAPEIMAALVEEAVLAEETVVVEDLEPVEINVEGIIPCFESIAPETIPDEIRTSALPPASDDPFTTLVFTLADVAISAGSPHVASMLPGLLFDGRAPDDLLAALDPSFQNTVAAWRAILRGTSEDFSDCGMLDEWASDLLARLVSVHTVLDAKATAPRLRQELRARGVAAFGLAA